MSKIIKANFNKNYQVESEMRDAISKFQFETSLASTLGVLEIIKKELMQGAENE